jgi:hypothetical protein
VAEFGTEAAILAVETIYDSGEMDISIIGKRAFHLDSYRSKVEDRLYGGGEVTIIENDGRVEPRDLDLLRTKFIQLHEFLETHGYEQDFDAENLSFRIGHQVGFSLKQKVRMVSMPRERDRQKKIVNHLDHILPLVSDLSDTRRRIRENGHFKVLPTLNFGREEI